MSEDAWREMRQWAARPERRNDLSGWMAGGGVPLGAGAEWRDGILERYAPFWKWVTEDMGRGDLIPGRPPRGVLGYHVELSGLGVPFPVHVIGLDSAWLCGDDNDAQKLLLTSDQIGLVAHDGEGRPLRGFRLALVHHPLSWLADGDSARRQLAGAIDLLLHGHQHEPGAAETVEPPVTDDETGRSLRALAAGSLYEPDGGDEYPDEFHVIDVLLTEDGEPLRYDVEFRQWKEGRWQRGSDLYKTEDGSLQWWTLLGERWRARRATERRRQLQHACACLRVFIGREEQLDTLRKVLLGPQAPEVVAITAVEGMPGVGKSYLAARFEQLHANEFPGGVVRLVLDPQNPPSVEALCEDACLQLQLQAPVGEARWEALTQRLRAPRTLSIIENADDDHLAGLAADFVACVPNCPVIVTGRFRGLGDTAGWQRVAVQPFSEADAMAQLTAELGDAIGRHAEADHKDLVRELGYLPQAIHLAAGHLRQPGQTCRGFLRKLRDSGLALAPADPADRGPLSRDQAYEVLRHSFEVSLALLEESLGPRAKGLLASLRALAHAPLSGVGRSLGAAIAGLDEDDFETLAVEACGLSLLEYDETRDRPHGFFRLHPLVAQLLRREEDREPALLREKDWFVRRLPEGGPWNEIHEESLALADWLRAVPDGSLRAVERAGSRFAMLCGPFGAWAELCERGLGLTKDAAERSNYLWTLGNVAWGAGDLDRARTAAEEKRELDRKRGAEREVALASGLLADLLTARGELDEALRTLREEALPAFERLGDVRERAVTLGKVADILYRWGELDEALRTLREEALPAFERLGDVRSQALTLGQIADILQARGELDEALRTLREEVLPAFERLGDVRERAVTLGKVADILQARGELDEALRIRQEEELPVYERLGAVRELLVGRAKAAVILLRRGKPGDREEARRLLGLALEAARKMRLPEAGQIEEIMRAAGMEDGAGTASAK